LIHRLGLFGGAFDPIHNGHLRLAETAEKECGLERILFLPSAFPPHKEPTLLTPFRHRLAMLNLALADKECFDCSPVEEFLSPPSYSIDTVQFLKKSLPPDIELFFLIGIDAFLEICTWKQYEELLNCVSFVVSEREGDLAERKRSLVKTLEYSQEGNLWKSCTDRKDIIFLSRPPLIISSSSIRKMVRNGKSILGLVPTPVQEYIMQNKLYRQE
jgi:nicotinate-nucleotide adenylyltransferase